MRLAELGRAAQQLVRWLDAGAELAPGTARYVYFGPRVLPGWAIELVLLAALLPFLVSAVDLFARCRRRHIPLTPALRSYRSRVGFWLWVAILFELFALIGVWPSAPAVPLPPDASPATSWPVIGVLALVFLSALGWLVAGPASCRAGRSRRPRSSRARPARCSPWRSSRCSSSRRIPFALIFLLPSLHAWLWLPHVRPRPIWTRLAVLGAGFLGPLLLLASLAVRYGLGLDAPWYLAELAATGYVGLPRWRSRSVGSPQQDRCRR